MTTIFDLVDADDGEGIRALLAGKPEAATTRDENGISPLLRACYRGSGAAFEAIRATVPPTDPWDRLAAGESEGLPTPDAWSPDGFTPLHLAAFAHNDGAARSLLASGADPDAISRASFARVTPLGTCAFTGATEVARVLLAHGADPSLTGERGGLPADNARANGYDELAALLESAG